MSWEYSKYEARCENCGKEGVCIRGSDDWNRSSTSWQGFDSKPPDPTDVGRKRADARDQVAVCNCGNSKIVVGKYLGETA
ncbi:MAG: hypothetical protein WAW02_14455 [Sideroxyarcus sp.]